MIKTIVTSIALAGLSIGVMAQKDSTLIKKDTVKSKQTGTLILQGSMFAFGPQTDSLKAKPTNKPDTLKTGSLTKTGSVFYAVSPQTDSLKSKSKPKAADTIKTKYAAFMHTATALACNTADGPQTDSSKTKPSIIRPDSTTKPGTDKKTGAMYFDKKSGSIMAMPKTTIYYI